MKELFLPKKHYNHYLGMCNPLSVSSFQQFFIHYKR